MSCEIPGVVLRWIQMVEQGEIRACKDQIALVAHIRKCFAIDDLTVDSFRLEKYLGLARYMPYKQLYEWEEFLTALHLCTYRPDGLPRWPDLFALLGRGAGKDGFIAYLGFCLVSPYNGIRGYNFDICANNETQAMTPVQDVIEALEQPAQIKALKKHYYWTKEEISGIKTRSKIKGRTNSPKGKDGMRSGYVAFNEIHQYENYDNINVFTTSLGKRPDPRRGYYSSQGDVRDGPIDDLIAKSEGILFGGEPDNGFLPFLCRLDELEQVHKQANWEMANPSLRHIPSLMEEIKKEYIDWVKDPGTLSSFMTKRMNRPQDKAVSPVADYEYVKKTNRELPDLTGKSCVVGIDYASINDFVSVDLHFKDGEIRYDISHSWLCLQSKDIPRIRAPWKEWARLGLLTPVDGVEVAPGLIAEYIQEAGRIYDIRLIAMDNYRYALMKRALADVGFDAEARKNIKLVRPSEIMKTAPVIGSVFLNEGFVWGDNPVLRWATNNTKKVLSGKTAGTDTGNYYYAKIESKSRKTDPFMALTAAMTSEDILDGGGALPDLGVITG